MLAFLFCTLATLAQRTTKQSDYLGQTDYGEWGVTWACKGYSYFSGFRIKVEKPSTTIANLYSSWRSSSWNRPPDQTAVNALEFLCEDETPQNVKASKERYSKAGLPGYGDYGEWSPWILCKPDHIITGVKVFSEPAQGPRVWRKTTHPDFTRLGKNDNDDTGINNVFFKCSHKFDKKVAPTWIFYDAQPPVERRREEFKNKAPYDKFMGWSEGKPQVFECNTDRGLYQYRANVESHQGPGQSDDSSMNQLQFFCGERPACENIELTNFQEGTCLKGGKVEKCGSGDPVQIDLNNPINEDELLETIDNCDHAGKHKWTKSLKKERSIDVSETYSFKQSFSSSFGAKMSDSVSVSVKKGMTFGIDAIYNGGVWQKSAVTLGKTESWNTKISSTETKASKTSVKEARGHETTWTSYVPGYSKNKIRARVTSYKGTVFYTADATCWDKGKTYKTGATKIGGTWDSISIAKESMEIEDVSQTCPKPKCKCESVYSKLLKGKKCEKASGVTANRNKGAAVNGGHFWCYVRRGACPADMSGSVNTKDDQGIKMRAATPDKFEWSNQPCRTAALVNAVNAIQGQNRRLDLGLMRPTPEGTEYAPFPEEPSDLVPAGPARRLAAPTPSPTTWLQHPSIPKYWPAYAMETCTCDMPLLDSPWSAFEPSRNTITCHWHVRVCPSGTVCKGTEAVWGDDWKDLCKQA